MQPIQPLAKRQREPHRQENSTLAVKKRSGILEPFDLAKIEASVTAAGIDTGEFGKKEADKNLEGLQGHLKNGFAKRRTVSVEEIRNIVEPAIAQAGYFATAKYYILYGSKKARGGEAFQIPEPPMPAYSLEVAKKRYLKTDMDGRVIETPGSMLWRVARHMAKAEIQWEDEREVERVARLFFERMVGFRFARSGRAVFEAGNNG